MQTETTAQPAEPAPPPHRIEHIPKPPSPPPPHTPNTQSTLHLPQGEVQPNTPQSQKRHSRRNRGILHFNQTATIFGCSIHALFRMGGRNKTSQPKRRGTRPSNRTPM